MFFFWYFVSAIQNYRMPKIWIICISIALEFKTKFSNMIPKALKFFFHFLKVKIFACKLSIAFASFRGNNCYIVVHPPSCTWINPAGSMLYGCVKIVHGASVSHHRLPCQMNCGALQVLSYVVRCAKFMYRIANSLWLSSRLLIHVCLSFVCFFRFVWFFSFIQRSAVCVCLVYANKSFCSTSQY